MKLQNILVLILFAVLMWIVDTANRAKHRWIDGTIS